MAPTSKNAPTLYCPKCGKRGFIRHKKSSFHISQKNKEYTIQEILDHTAKVFFNVFRYSLDVNTEEKLCTLDDYKAITPFANHSIEEIEQFEKEVLEIAEKKYPKENYILRYSDELKSYKCIKNDNTEVKPDLSDMKRPLFFSRSKVIRLYESICFTTLRKCIEYFNLKISKELERELISSIRNYLYFFIFVFPDKRRKFDLATMLKVSNMEKEHGINHTISKNLLNIEMRCPNCKIKKSINKSLMDKDKMKFKRCNKCNQLLEKVKPTTKYIKKILSEMDIVLAGSYRDDNNFASFILAINEYWFNNDEKIRIFHKFFYETKKEYLKKLEMYGDTSFVIVHYENKKKTQCYLKEEKDFLGIRIEQKDYKNSFKQAINIRYYNQTGNIYEYIFRVIDTLLLLKFPIKYISSKIMTDFNRFYWECAIEEAGIKLKETIRSLKEFIKDIKSQNDVSKSMEVYFRHKNDFEKKWRRISVFLSNRNHDDRRTQTNMKFNSWLNVDSQIQELMNELENLKTNF